MHIPAGLCVCVCVLPAFLELHVTLIDPRSSVEAAQMIFSFVPGFTATYLYGNKNNHQFNIIKVRVFPRVSFSIKHHTCPEETRTLYA